jgi:predicted Zn finger-like uncharacterized protein
MNITCDKCQSKFRIPDEKIPAGKTAIFQCTKCKNRLSVSLNQKTDDLSKDSKSYPEVGSEAYDVSEKPFDFIGEENKTALVCEPDLAARQKMMDALESMEYHITVAENIRDALKKMRYHVYDIILVNEKFDAVNPASNSVLIYLERLNMAIRRNIFVVLISRGFRTMDNMTALNKSVNMLINIKDIDNIDKILGRGIRENDLFYRVYKDSLRKKTGEI